MPSCPRFLRTICCLSLVVGAGWLMADDLSEPTRDDAGPRLSLPAARERALLMHDVYAATLDTIHHRYFRREQPVVPARAMEDVFAEMARKHRIQARWISASFSPLGIDHEPQTEFEKQAARKLAAGEAQVEMIEQGQYRRAGSIPLSGGCVTCHAGVFNSQSASAKFAGLIISIPVETGAKLPPVAGGK